MHPAGRNLRCYVFTEGHNLQVLSVRFLQGGILHQTFSFSFLLQEQQVTHLHTSNSSRPDETAAHRNSLHETVKLQVFMVSYCSFIKNTSKL